MLMSIAKTIVMPRERVISGASEGEDENRQNYALRPEKFAQYVGQESLIRKLRGAPRLVGVVIVVARDRPGPLEVSTPGRAVAVPELALGAAARGSARRHGSASSARK